MEQFIAGLKESKRVARTEGELKRFSIFGHPTSIGGSGSENHQRGGSHHTFGRSGTMKETIDLEIQRAHMARERITSRWQLPGIDAFRNEGSNKIKNQGMFEKKGEEEVGTGVCKWMLHFGMAFNATTVPLFQTMCDAITETRPQIRGPTPNQLANIYLPREVDELKEYIQGLKKE